MASNDSLAVPGAAEAAPATTATSSSAHAQSASDDSDSDYDEHLPDAGTVFYTPNTTEREIAALEKEFQDLASDDDVNDSNDDEEDAGGSGVLQDNLAAEQRERQVRPQSRGQGRGVDAAAALKYDGDGDDSGDDDDGGDLTTPDHDPNALLRSCKQCVIL